MTALTDAVTGLENTVASNTSEIAKLDNVAAAHANDILALKSAVTKLQAAAAPVPPTPTPTPTPTPSTHLITSFSPSNNVTIGVDGKNAQVENANKTWSISNPANDTLRFEVRSGDVWPNDATAGNTSERSEVEMQQRYAADKTISVAYGFTVEAGPTNISQWMVLGQIHNVIKGGSPPFCIAMYDEKMVVIVRGSGSNGKENDIWTDANPIQRGHEYAMSIQAMFGSNGNGTLKVVRDGVVIVNYAGPLGSGSASETYYWKHGIYRNPASMTIAAKYRNLSIVAA